MPYGVSKHKPYFGVGTYSGFGGVFDVNKNQWYQNPSVFSDTMDTTTNWTASEITGGTASTISSVNGELKIFNNGATYGSAYKVLTTIVGKRYKMVYITTSLSAAAVGIQIGTTLHGNDVLPNSTIPIGTVGERSFTASTTTTYVEIYNTNTAGAISTWDNVAIYPINNDGSVDLSSATPLTASRNYLNAKVMADAGGQPTLVEQLPKIEYKDILKANEYQGKNAITAKVTFNRSTYVLNSGRYNIASAINNGTSVTTFNFEKPMDSLDYEVVIDAPMASFTSNAMMPYTMNKTLTGFQVYHYNTAGGGSNPAYVSIIVTGGKN